MTQKNGTIEFIRDPEKQCACVYIPQFKRTVKFDLHSNRFFTSDPIVIKKLDSLQYKRGKVKIDGIAVEPDKMNEDQINRVQKNIDREASKLGVETIQILSEENKDTQNLSDSNDIEIISESKKTDQENLDEIEEIKQTSIDKTNIEKPAKKKAGKKPSEKLKKEIG
jgi:hypothetical protein